MFIDKSGINKNLQHNYANLDIECLIASGIHNQAEIEMYLDKINDITDSIDLTKCESDIDIARELRLSFIERYNHSNEFSIINLIDNKSGDHNSRTILYNIIGTKLGLNILAGELEVKSPRIYEKDIKIFSDEMNGRQHHFSVVCAEQKNILVDITMIAGFDTCYYQDFETYSPDVNISHILNNRGLEHLRKNDYSKAVNLLKEAIKANKDYSHSYACLGYTYLNLCNECIKKDENELESEYHRNALKYLLKASRLKGAMSRIFYTLAKLSKNSFVKEKYYKKAVRTNPFQLSNYAEFYNISN